MMLAGPERMFSRPTERLLMTKTPVGGFSNTPPTAPKTIALDVDSSDYVIPVSEEYHLKKRKVIDWISYSFDTLTFDYDKNSTPEYLPDILANSPKNFFLISRLFVVLKAYMPWDQYALDSTFKNGYKFTIHVNEFTELLLMGPQMKSGKASCQLLMSGSGCFRFVFIDHGSIRDLLKFCREKLKTGHFTRIDPAVDDFTGDQFDLYDIEELVKKKHYVSRFENYRIIGSGSKTANRGFTIYFGSIGSTLIRCYDKKKERSVKGYPHFDSDVWYRYEMSLTGDAADSFVDEFLLSCDNDSDLSALISSLLNSFLSFRTPGNSRSESDLDHVYEWPLLPSWKSFLDDFQEDYRLESIPKTISTISKKKEWSDQNMSRFYGQLFCVYEDDYVVDHLVQIGKGIANFNDKQKDSINSARSELGKAPLSNSDFLALSKKYIHLLDQTMNLALEDEPLPY